jgi:hypothetical protein
MNIPPGAKIMPAATESMMLCDLPGRFVRQRTQR